MLAARLTRDNWVVLLLGVYLLFESLRDLGTGSAVLFFRTVKRSEDGYLYWWAIGMELTLGVAGLVLFVTRMVS